MPYRTHPEIAAPYFHIARMRAPTSTRTCRVLRSPAALVDLATVAGVLLWLLMLRLWQSAGLS